MEPCRLIRLAEYELDPANHILRRRGSLVKLPPQPFKVLTLLANRPNELVTREELREAIWGNAVVVDFEHGLNTCIRKIRTALGEEAGRARIIETVARLGYRLNGVLSPAGALTYSSAGHEPPLLIRRTRVESLEAGGLVLGLFGHAAYEPGSVQLEPGDIVVVCSDGVTEAQTAAEEEFGRDRFVSSVEGAHGMEPGAVLERVLRAVREFTAGAPQADDLTALVLRYRGR